ncbi:Ribosomal RNA large subunit methyltransferase E [Carpediemonas membranifera]|uniref:Ribosomal RNA large subunit methyltransferase E n=1 Tax=Carpediemonas membranifera TaxID=201153 RepID=A0A8J6AUG1_9EUKA|nr:Ribosomal RNA large subunit methyltransferase E [Carpediemonas membranifera]|eukprot:KAG9391860.1 Ribosomal RNA large subunit methyltransferase E [Carpediemonas membranifera]
MGAGDKDRHQKTGKGRLDHFYYLAKQRGLRSRAAFKIEQLGKDFNLFEDCNVILDLCAAPGGWTQIAAKEMPKGGLVVAVDLDPIPTIDPSTVNATIKTYVTDITTEHCRSTVRKAVKEHFPATSNPVVDVVLHDGAPNMGADWNLDAFQQNMLVVHAMRLAADMLKVGGTFVTKVFRSRHYNNLLALMNELFEDVQARTPKATRETSAETFIVCRRFNMKRYAKIDKEFFNFDNIFVDQDANEPVRLKDIVSSKPNQDGYSYVRGGVLLEKKIGLTEYLSTDLPADLLNDANIIEIDPETDAKALEVLSELKIWPRGMKSITDLQDVAADLKVQSKDTIKSLLNWQRKIRFRFLSAMAPLLESGSEEEGEGSESASGSENEDDALDSGSSSESESDTDEELDDEIRRQKRREKAKLRRSARRKKARLSRMVMGNVDPLIALETAEGEARTLFTQKILTGEVEIDDEEPEPTKIEVRDNSESDASDAEKDEFADKMKSTLVNRPKVSLPTSNWWQNEIFSEDEDESSASEASDAELDKEMPKRQAKKTVEEWSSDDESNSDTYNSSNQSGSDNDDEELDSDDGWTTDDSARMAQKLAIGAKMMRKKQREEMEDAAYNRYNFDDEGVDMPEWFAKEDAFYNRPMMPVTKEEVEAFRARRKQITERPTKKLLEFKARQMQRKKREEAKILAKAAHLADQDIPATEKLREAEKLGRQRSKLDKKIRQKPKAKRLDKRMKADGAGHALAGGSGKKALRKNGVLSMKRKQGKAAGKTKPRTRKGRFGRR